MVTYCTGYHPESVRRAYKTLEAKGYVTLGRDFGWRLHPAGDGMYEWVQLYDTTSPTAVLCVDEHPTLRPDVRPTK